MSNRPDPIAAAIPARCDEAARPDGRVGVPGGVGPNDAPRGLSIEMVLVGGKQRTVAESRELAREARPEVLASGPLPSDPFVVECRPNPPD